MPLELAYAQPRLLLPFEGEKLQKLVLTAVLDEPQLHDATGPKLVTNQTPAPGTKPYFPLPWVCADSLAARDLGPERASTSEAHV